jgi:hypothetical protein
MTRPGTGPGPCAPQSPLRLDLLWAVQHASLQTQSYSSSSSSSLALRRLKMETRSTKIRSLSSCWRSQRPFPAAALAPPLPPRATPPRCL